MSRRADAKRRRRQRRKQRGDRRPAVAVLVIDDGDGEPWPGTLTLDAAGRDVIERRRAA